MAYSGICPGGVVSKSMSLAAWTALAVFASTGLASAHHQRANQNNSGMPIPNLTHGQLHVMSEYRSAILQLAEKPPSPDLQTRTLTNFANIQHAYCMWGIVPGSIANETSAFNECTHADLAAVHALLTHLEVVPDTQREAQKLASAINDAMMRDNSALQLCRNSFDSFNTAEIIYPDWAGYYVNPLTALFVLTMCLPVFSAIILPRVIRERPRGDDVGTRHLS